MRIISDGDAELIAEALSKWANFIETGNLSLSASDIREMESRGFKSNPMRQRINNLDTDQRLLVNNLRRVAIQVGSPR